MLTSGQAHHFGPCSPCGPCSSVCVGCGARHDAAGTKVSGDWTVVLGDLTIKHIEIHKKKTYSMGISPSFLHHLWAIRWWMKGAVRSYACIHIPNPRTYLSHMIVASWTPWTPPCPAYNGYYHNLWADELGLHKKPVINWWFANRFWHCSLKHLTRASNRKKSSPQGINCKLCQNHPGFIYFQFPHWRP